MRIITCLLIILSVYGQAMAVDPPKLLKYKKLYIYALVNGGSNAFFTQIDKEYSDRLVTSITPVDATINKVPAVYYDSTKSLFEFYELVHNREGLTAEEIAVVDQIPSKIAMANKILAAKYTREAELGDDAGSGFMAYPHGLDYIYTSTADSVSFVGLKSLRIEGSWVESGNVTRNYIGYGRDCAFTLQVGIAGLKHNLPYKVGKFSHEQLISTYVEYCKSILNQWATGEYYIFKEGPYYMSTLQVGVTTAALIEYYERVYQDPTIPPLVKAAIDRLYGANFYPDVTNPFPPDGVDNYTNKQPGAGFWGWTDWVVDHYEIGYSHGVTCLHNILVGHAYAWYATISGDSGYMDKANVLFDGLVENFPVNNVDAQLSEGTRYISNYLRYYRKFYGSTCAAPNIEQCTTQASCTAEGGNWTGEYCRWAPVVVPTLTGLSMPLDAVCDNTHLSLCTTETPCIGAGGYWYNSTCNASQQPASNGINFGHSGTLTITPAVTGGASIGVTGAP